MFCLSLLKKPLQEGNPIYFLLMQGNLIYGYQCKVTQSMLYQFKEIKYMVYECPNDYWKDTTRSNEVHCFNQTYA